LFPYDPNGPPGKFVMPHEIGHLLLNSGDHVNRANYGDFWETNLMKFGAPLTELATEAKRLTTIQGATMRGWTP